MTEDFIRIEGADTHNLKHVSVDIPRNQLTVVTGVSGSGKSSLAFDTLYAEGQRRYVESISAYARQFLGLMDKPDVDLIEGLSPAISIDQKSTNRNPRSTVGTVTEIYDYFRLLYARIGIPHCPNCGREIMRQTVDQMVDTVMALPEGTKFQLLAPVVRGRKGRHEKVLAQAKRSGYVRVLVDGSMYDLSEEIILDKNKKHDISIVVDRLVVKEGIRRRLNDSIEAVMKLADGLMVVDVIGGKAINMSNSFACPDCGISIDEIEPRSFSFNNPFGACPTCFGLGYKMEFDVDLMIPDKSISIADGAIVVLGWQSCTDKKSYTRAILDALAKEYKFDLETPFEDMSEEAQNIILHGTNGHEVKVHYKGQRGEGVYDVAFEGLIRNVQRRYREAGSESMKEEYESFMTITPCDDCGGQRLKKESLAVTVGGKNIYEITQYSIDKLVDLKKPVFLILNKIDKLTDEEILLKITEYKDLYEFAEIIPVSALKNDNTNKIIKVLQNYLPDNFKYFMDGEKTTLEMEFRLSEIVREKIFIHTNEEVPHSISCKLIDYEEKDDIAKIYIDIIVDRDSLRKIIVGHNGSMIKTIGHEARLDMESLLGKKVYLELYCKTIKKW